MTRKHLVQICQCWNLQGSVIDVVLVKMREHVGEEGGLKKIMTIIKNSGTKTISLGKC